jgi:competence protein ComGC
MDGSSRKPPAVGFWIAMIIVVLLVAVLLWIGIPVLAQFLAQAWDRLFGHR